MTSKDMDDASASAPTASGLASARELAAIVEWSTDAIYSTSSEGMITTWNRSAERLFGFASQEVIGRPVALLSPLDRADESAQIMARLALGETVDHFPSVRRRKDGSLVDVSLSVAAVRDERGRIVGFSAIARDITKRLEGLRDRTFLLDLAGVLTSTADPDRLTAEATRRLAEYLEVAGSSLWDVDLTHDISYARLDRAAGEAGGSRSIPVTGLAEGAAELFAAGELLVVADAESDPRTRGDRFERWYRPTGTRALLMVPVLRAGRCVAALELWQDAPRAWSERDQGLAREVASRLWPALETVRALAAEREARLAAESASIESEMALEEAHAAFAEAERARAEAQSLAVAIEEANQELVRLAATAEAANRAKSEFLAVMSHELRTPLTAIAGYAQLLEMGLFGPLTEKQLQQIGRIRHAEEHLLRVIEGVLAFTRVEVGKTVFDIEDVAVADVLVGVDLLVGPSATSAGIELVLPLPPREVVARADRDKLRQIVLNLLTNAIKFTPTGGRVRLETQANDEVVIRVHDTGIGIPADKLELIFEPFTQVDMANTRERGGTGLGLAISRDFARGMGGDISVVSVLGVGSIFSVRLPRAETSRAERSANGSG